jgi:arginine deiminase
VNYLKRVVNVYSEIGPLKTVLLHRPGEEIENLTPNYLEKLLFDDIPFLKIAKMEHDNFAKVLKENGVEVLYLENLAAVAVKNQNVKERFLNEIIKESGIGDISLLESLKVYLSSMPEKEMVDKIMSGVRKNEIGINEDFDQFPFLLEPMPNLYFTRDPFASIGKGITINSMKYRTRRRESIFPKYIFKYHPDFMDSNIPVWYKRSEKHSLEGGDELVLSKEVLAFGISQRTDSEAVLKSAENILSGGDTFKVMLMLEIPKERAFMHLDTVFTMLDFDKFTVHEEIEKEMKIRSVTYDSYKKEVVVVDEEDNLESILSKYLKRDVTLIRCGGDDKVISAREQWNDASNTLALSPGKVITYDRNYVTNEVLDKHNISVISIPSSELSRGRGGPRCMSMPIYREEI